MLVEEMALEPAKLSDFVVAGSLGSGSTAKVYEAVHRASGRAVAIKVMDLGSSGAGMEMRERFAREALLLAGVDSRFVGKILGFGFERGQPFLVLERLQGETLDAKLRRDGPVAPHLAFRWLEQLIVGVRDCHDAKVIHRDIKPSNIFLHTEGLEESAKLIDFGVARLRDLGPERDLTGTHHMIGSMAYMAPEQLENPKMVGFEADLYAVGVVVFRTLTGRLPFVSRSLEAVIRMKAEKVAPPISSIIGSLQVPLLDAFVHRAMRRDPAARFRSAREMLEGWRSVMSSLEEENTDIMGGIGRVDESYAGPRPRAPLPTPLEEALDHPAFVDDRTLRRFDLPLPSAVSPGMFESGESRSHTEHSAVTRVGSHMAATVVMRVGEKTLAAAGLHGAPDPEAAAPYADPTVDDDTRSDPRLRELVQRELDLYRGREPKR
jgi:serine/threonine-protein kinase